MTSLPGRQQSSPGRTAAPGASAASSHSPAPVSALLALQKTGIFFRATEQWFASIDGFRQATLEAIRKVRWIPAWGEERIYSMVANRATGAFPWECPSPIFYRKECGKELINDQTISHLQELFRNTAPMSVCQGGRRTAAARIKCPHCSSGEFSKEKDIMDVWFDSGTSPPGRSGPESRLAGFALACRSVPGGERSAPRLV